MTLVTVLMPVYNVAPWLPETISSILNQTFTDFDFLIINDGSTDNSGEIINSFNDPRIRYIKNSRNLGYIECLNFGLKSITSKYIVRMDADDISMPDRLAKQVAYMEAHPEVVVCGGSRINLFEESTRKPQLIKAVTDTNRLFIQSIFNTSIHHPSAIIRTSVVKENQLEYKERFYYAEDKEFWLKLSQFGLLANVSDPVLYYRIHSKQVTFLFLETQRANSTTITQEFFNRNGICIPGRSLKALRKICYEESCTSLSELREVEELIFFILEKALATGLAYSNELEIELKKRMVTIVSRSSRVGFEMFAFVYKSKLISLMQMGPSTYLKIGARYFYKGNNPLPKGIRI
ncbi:glycosyltransferase family 2 protein [Litoribacter ruber]|uniref:glycosyltransferase family 2 protein n=1 Tax=Litoribacter ruber TaxID=702568 RepID=UPI001BD94806|nr:glycosyltransferase family 2 protein [Litoribacter ruber]MBT0810641.1 glycosyltransferase family 2 protein [Litoribacter ruber]